MSSRKPPSQRNSESTLQRVARTLQSMSPGTMGGRVANAAPVTVGPAQEAPLSNTVLDGSDVIAPSPPSGVDFTSYTYYDPVTGIPFDVLTMAWSAPTTSVDLTDLTDLKGYVAEWQYVADATAASNLLSSNDQSFETNIGTWTASGATLVTSSTQKLTGAFSLRATSAAGGTVTANTGRYPITNATRSYQGFVPVFATSVRTGTVFINWYNASNVLLGVSAAATTLAANAWTTSVITALPPNGTTQAAVGVTVTGTATSEQFYVDNAGIIQDNWTPLGFTGSTFISWSPVQTGKLVQARVAAVDSANNLSTYTPTPQHVTSSASNGLGGPSVPSVAGTIGGLRVTWDGNASSGVPYGPAFNHLAIYYNTPNPTLVGATLWGSLKNPHGGQTTITGPAYNTDYWVGIVAYDTSGNPSSVTWSSTTSRILHVNGEANGDITSVAFDIMSAGTLNAAAIIGTGRISVVANSTSITVASNGLTLPRATVNVVSTTGFPTSGQLRVVTSTGTSTVTYTGKTSTAFTGCTGGTGVMSIGGSVTAIAGMRTEMDSNGFRGYDSTSTSATTGKIFELPTSGAATIGGWIIGANSITDAAANMTIGSTFGGYIIGGLAQFDTFQTASSGTRITITAAAEDKISFYVSSGTAGYMQTLTDTSFGPTLGTLIIKPPQYAGGNAYVILNEGGFLDIRNPAGPAAALFVAGHQAVYFNPAGTVTVQLGDNYCGKSIIMGQDVQFPVANGTIQSTNARLDGANNSLQRQTSLRSAKTNIETVDDALKVLDLRPVRFQSVLKADDPDVVHWGLIAEEVEEVLPELALYENGQLESVAYDRVAIPLLGVAQIHDHRIEALEKAIDAILTTAKENDK